MAPKNEDNYPQDELREIAHNLGGWDEVRKLIEALEESDAEAAWERHCNEPEAWEGGFAENH